MKKRYSVILFFSLVIFSGLTTNLFFLLDHGLYWDTLAGFPLYQEHLYSLSKFGTIAWWFPHVQDGWPTEWLGILAAPGISPLFVLLAGTVWTLGKLFIVADEYFYIFIFYYGVVLCGAFLFSVWILARELFEHRIVRAYILVTCAFSPGVIMQLSDGMVLESLTFFVLLIATTIRGMKDPNQLRVYVWIAAIYGFILSIKLNSMFFVLPAFLIVILITFCFSSVARQSAKIAVRNVRLRDILFLTLGVAACILPFVITAQNINDFTVSSPTPRPDHGLYYDFRSLKPGNPIEFLLGSTPGLGFEWYGGYRALWQLMPMEMIRVGYVFLRSEIMPLHTQLNLNKMKYHQAFFQQ